MTQITKEAALGAVADGLAFLKKIAPYAATIGLPQVAIIAGVTATIGQELLERGADAADALDENDEAVLKGLLAEIQPINDDLARQVAES